MDRRIMRQNYRKMREGGKKLFGLSSVLLLSTVVPAVRCKSGTRLMHKTFTGLSVSIRQPIIVWFFVQQCYRGFLQF
jgi:hypothetical protein